MAPIDEYHHPEDLPGTVPLFPLSGAILLPRAQLPLNVFEPRYLAMIDWVLAHDRVIGIIQPDETAAGESPKGTNVPLKPIGCVGRLTAYQELDDGRLLISLNGVCRFRLAAEAETDEPFRLCNVEYTDFAHDLVRGGGEDEVDREGLLHTLKDYLEANRLAADWEAIANAPTELLVNSLSVISPFGPEEKQALLEAHDLKGRAEVLAALAQMELAADDRSGGQLQ